MLTLTDIQPQKNEVYLDNNATTPVLPQAAEAAMHAMQLCYGNPSSSHVSGLQAKYILESTRTLIRQVVGADKGALIFTSGATEGIQTAIISALNEAKAQGIKPEKPVLLYGATEHKAVPNTLVHWNEVLGINAEVIAIPVDEDGILDHEFIAEHINNALMVCTMAVNNETGTYQDLKQLEKVIRAGHHRVLWMVDCVQALGKRPLALSSSAIDYALFSGHKLYAMKGIGVLYIRDSAPYTACIAGGGQEGGLRSGTENLPGIASLNAIFALLADKNDDTFKSQSTLNSYREQLVDTLTSIFPKIVFNHNLACSVPTTLNFSVEGLSAKDIMDLFDAAGIRVSSGSACSSKVTGSFVLDAMGKSRWQSEGAIRLSFGPAAKQEEIDEACQAIVGASQVLRNSCLILSDTSEDTTQPINGLQQWVVNQHSCWFYADTQTKECVLIDPVPEVVSKFETLVNCQNYRVKGILSTHKYSDAANCRDMLAEIVARAMTVSEGNELGWPELPHAQAVKLDNGLTVPFITLGDKVLAKMSFPGHTENSQVYLLGTLTGNKLTAEQVEYAFTGASLFAGGLGKTNLAVSFKERFFESLQNLDAVITRDTLLCPSKDPNQYFMTTLAREMRATPLLASVLDSDCQLSEFLVKKSALDTITDEAKSTFAKAELNDLSPESLAQFLRENSNLTIIDVREKYEFEADQSSCFGGVSRINVPLSQLSAFVNSNQLDVKQPVVCLCRSGNRSGLAGRALSRMGFEQVHHIPGGIALLD